VQNPGGKAQTAVSTKAAVSTNAVVYILLPGPPPSNMTLNLNLPYSPVGPSLGETPVDIQGQAMDFTKKVSSGRAAQTAALYDGRPKTTDHRQLTLWMRRSGCQQDAFRVPFA